MYSRPTFLSSETLRKCDDFLRYLESMTYGRAIRSSAPLDVTFSAFHLLVLVPTLRRQPCFSACCTRFLRCSRSHDLFFNECPSPVPSKGFGSRARRHLCPPYQDAGRQFCHLGR